MLVYTLAYSVNLLDTTTHANALYRSRQQARRTHTRPPHHDRQRRIHQGAPHRRGAPQGIVPPSSSRTTRERPLSRLRHFFHPPDRIRRAARAFLLAQGRIGAGGSDQAVAHLFPAGGRTQAGCGRLDR